MRELWVRIPDHPDYYVSNTGLVASYKYKIWKILKPSLRGAGKNKTSCIVLSENSVSFTLSVSKLVARAFLDYNSNVLIRHLDKNPSNNSIDNLKIRVIK